MPADVKFIKKLEPIVEWVVFRSTWLFLVVAVLICSCAVLFQWWASLAVHGASPLKGRVSVAGRPVTHGTVTVITADGGVRSTQIQPDGMYEFRDIPHGSVQIAVSSPEPRSVFQKAIEGVSLPQLRDLSAEGFGPLDSPKLRQSKPEDEESNVAIALTADTLPPSANAESRPEHDRWFRIPGRYANPASSGLRATVDPSGANADLDLSPKD